MYNSQDVAERIKELAQKRNVSVKQVLSDIGLGFNTMSNMKTSMPKSDNLAKIADYLNCSVDYLLGRTDNPEVTGGAYINGNNNGIQAVSHDNSKLTVNGNTKSSTDTDELVELIQGLPLVQRAKIITQIDEMKNKK